MGSRLNVIVRRPEGVAVYYGSWGAAGLPEEMVRACTDPSGLTVRSEPMRNCDSESLGVIDVATRRAWLFSLHLDEFGPRRHIEGAIAMALPPREQPVSLTEFPRLSAIVEALEQEGIWTWGSVSADSLPAHDDEKDRAFYAIMSDLVRARAADDEAGAERIGRRLYQPLGC